MRIELSAEELMAILNSPREPGPPTIYELLGPEIADRINLEYVDIVPVEIGDRSSSICEWRLTDIIRHNGDKTDLREEHHRVHIGHVRDQSTGDEWYVRDFSDPYTNGKGYKREVEKSLWQETLSPPNRVDPSQLRQRVVEIFGRHFGFRDLQQPITL